MKSLEKSYTIKRHQLLLSIAKVEILHLNITTMSLVDTHDTALGF